MESGDAVRVLCYNIRHGQGVGGILSNRRIARVITDSGCDVALLSEVWRIAKRYDQPSVLSELTAMTPAFHPLVSQLGREAGNLVLSAVPPKEVRLIDLGGRRERRGCVVASYGEAAGGFAVAGTHLSLHRETRRRQLERLADEFRQDVPVVLGGDFNCGVAELSPLSGVLSFPEDVPRTYPSVAPMRALDHIGFSREWRLESLVALPSWASDHLPLVAELTLDTPSQAPAATGSSSGSPMSPASR